MDNVIDVNNLNKTFHIREKETDSLKNYFYNFFRKNSKKEIKALENINFKVKKGEFFGIIGKNGSGKSTLLKLIMGSYRADKGSDIKISGTMMRLALGLGFDYNLSARENIYVNGAIIGLTFKEIGEKFYQIIEFAELEDFVDTAIKYYSSGMKSRLAFSIAVHTKADILLIDEFFGGVGDESFKKKSEKVFSSTFLDGRTIVFVTHDLNKIVKYSDRALLLQEGKQVFVGNPVEAVNKYYKIIDGINMNKEKTIV